MKVLMISTDFPYLARGQDELVQGGAAACVAQLASALHEKKIDAEVITRKERECTEIYKFPIYRTYYLNLGFRSSKITHALSATLKALSISNRFDVVHSHNPAAGIAGAIASRLRGKPHLLTMHGPWAGLRRNPLVRAVARAIEAFVALNSDFITCDSRELVEEMKRYGVTEKRLMYIPNAIDVKCFKKEKSTMRRVLGIKENEVVILYTGRFVEEKGLPYLLDAMGDILGKRKGTELILVGGGADERILKQWMEKYPKTAKHTKIVPFVNYDKMVGVYNAADIFVLPSLAEGMSRSVLEAMACELAVVSTDTGGSKDLLAEGRGILVRPKSSADIKSAVTKLLKSKKLREMMGKKARVFVAKNMSVELRVGEFMKVYKRLT